MHPLVNIAITAAREAAEIIHRSAQQLDRIKVMEKATNDFFSEVDIKVEQAIIKTIHKSYPNHSIMAEESGYHEHEESEYTWIIDPIDGTTNFLKGYPFYAISIAVKHHNRIEHGVIYDPIRHECFHASRGQGAKLNNTRIRVNQERLFEKTLIGTGFPFKSTQTAAAYFQTLSDIFNKCAGVRRTGSAALDLAYVACGRLDGFWEINLKPWDIAAGSLLIKEAGGLVTDLRGEERFLDNGQVVAGNPKTLKSLLQALRPLVEANAAN